MPSVLQKRLTAPATTALFRLLAIAVVAAPFAHAAMEVTHDPATGQFAISHSGKPVLRYNYQTIEPGNRLAGIHTNNWKYARARSNYIHPLYGIDGEELTQDWPVDHPHHRGIYWAWPEVQHAGELGDLHALQRVFARPTGKCVVKSSANVAEIDAENIWKWDDREPVVHERAIIRAHRATELGRFIDLEFHFKALAEGVSIARRGTDKYGGLNIRLAAVEKQEIALYTDPPETQPRAAWARLSGIFLPSKSDSSIVVLQHAANPCYPGDWVQFPEINWFQPTFPAAGTRFALKKDQPLVLRFRLWIRRGKASPAECATEWEAFSTSHKP